ncbi:tripartite ATP-independent transporter DctP family solute receptor [Arthrobacter sp. B2I5]|uniref:DctP family TRAP transporter solute-binding subunit n=1 Tax=Arthrobacter sp. B2I5 TaxID=3042266 RepID=UPI0027813F02|nr:DctP family TRAP transporter solute-binding subunit [Arthrobacter sp. B2I5]MDQ0823854.1 tripartite ATP-independent transporter DctP family solute receptor [Arthrobacter sp. B2I5]
MNLKTRAITGVLATSLAAALLTGCAGGAPAGQSGPVAKIQLSIPDPLTSSVGVTAQHFADQVKKTSNGSVQVTVVPNGTSFSGDQNAAVTRLQGGSLDGLILSTSVYASVVPEMNGISIPYLFADTKEEAKFLAGEPGKVLKEKLAAKDTVALSFLTRTGREITNSVRPIEQPSDLKGLKIRVPGNTLWTDFFGKLGASPTTMAFSEVFTGLQTGTIDGQENPIEVPWTNKFSEVQKYVSMTNHINDAWVLALSSKKWDSLTDDQKKALTTASEETATFKTGYDEEQSKKQLDELAAKGMKANELSASGLAEFKAASQSLYPEFSKLIGKEFFDQAIAFAGKK